MSGVYVCIATRDGRVDCDVLERAAAACRYAAAKGMQTKLGRCADPYSVAACRNKGVAEFLRLEFDRLLFLDDDVLVQENTVALLAEHHRPIVGGCVPSIKIPAVGPPSAYVQVQRPFGEWYREWPPASLVDAEAVGGGCMMIDREVLRAMDFPWFRWPEQFHDGKLTAISDDTDFCGRAKMLGFSVHADGRVRCGHKKTIDVAMLIGN